jgi:hypothetical protein
MSHAGEYRAAAPRIERGDASAAKQTDHVPREGVQRNFHRISRQLLLECSGITPTALE